MAQLSHAANLVQQLSMKDMPQEELTERLTAQLSHSEGIRGFFATYLTGEGDTVADLHEVPTPLAKAMAHANQKELIPLACMYRCESATISCGRNVVCSANVSHHLLVFQV